jgi:hypothetical protein
MNLLFWTLLNLGVPIIGPIFTLALVAPTHGLRVARALIAASVKDGQLFWCAIGLCAAAIYEAVTALERGSAGVPMLELGIAGFCFAAFTCSVVVMLVSIKAHQERETRAILPKHAVFTAEARSRRTMGVSIAATLVVAICFSVLHVYLN